MFIMKEKCAMIKFLNYDLEPINKRVLLLKKSVIAIMMKT